MTVSWRWVFWSSVAVALLVVHFVFEFAAWASHPGNSVPGSGGSAIPWSIASFPVFLFMGRGGENFFWEAMIANSLIWGVGLTLIVKHIFGGE
jgi:hypothetical protein